MSGPSSPSMNEPYKPKPSLLTASVVDDSGIKDGLSTDVENAMPMEKQAPGSDKATEECDGVQHLSFPQDDGSAASTAPNSPLPMSRHRTHLEAVKAEEDKVSDKKKDKALSNAELMEIWLKTIGKLEQSVGKPEKLE